MAETSDFSNTLGSHDADWHRHLEQVNENWYYYNGDVFEETAEPPADGTPAPLLYPLRINLAEMLCRATAGIFLGEYDGVDPINIEFERDRDSGRAEGRADAAKDAWNEILAGTPLGPMVLRGAVEQGVTGGWYVQIKKRPLSPPWLVYRTDTHVRPKWHPDNPMELLGAELTFNCTYEEAELLAGKELKKRGLHATYSEIWTKETLTIKVDDVTVKTEPNRLRDRDGTGMIPFVYFPRYRASHPFWGVDLVSGIIGLMLEINIRMRDIGDAIEYNAHPYFWVRNVRKNTSTFSKRPGAIWNLGDDLGGNSRPEAGILDGKGVDQSAFDYLQALYQSLRYLSSITPVDVGEDEGSQRSGLTLEVRKMPAIQLARMTRLYWTISMRQLVQKALLVYAQSTRSLTVPPSHLIQVQWADFLPRDREQVVNEIVQLASLQEPLISPEQAMELLKRPDPEEELKRLETIKRERLAQQEKQKQMEQEAALKLAQTRSQAQAKASKSRKAKAA